MWGLGRAAWALLAWLLAHTCVAREYTIGFWSQSGTEAELLSWQVRSWSLAQSADSIRGLMAACGPKDTCRGGDAALICIYVSYSTHFSGSGLPKWARFFAASLPRLPVPRPKVPADVPIPVPQPTIAYLNNTLASQNMSFTAVQILGVNNDYLYTDMLVTPVITQVCLDIFGSGQLDWSSWQPIANIVRPFYYPNGTQGEIDRVCGLVIAKRGSGVNTFADLVGKRIEASHPLIAEAGQLQLYEVLLRTGANLVYESSAFRVAYSAAAGFSDPINMVQHVLSGDTDAAFLRMDYLEYALNRVGPDGLPPLVPRTFGPPPSRPSRSPTHPLGRA